MSSSTPTSSTPATSTELEQLQGFTMAKYMEMHWRHRFQYLKARMELQSYLVKVRLPTRPTRHLKNFHILTVMERRTGLKMTFRPSDSPIPTTNAV